MDYKNFFVSGILFVGITASEFRDVRHYGLPDDLHTHTEKAPLYFGDFGSALAISTSGCPDLG
jgi:hypothetical protein